MAKGPTFFWDTGYLGTGRFIAVAIDGRPYAFDADAGTWQELKPAEPKDDRGLYRGLEQVPGVG